MHRKQDTNLFKSAGQQLNIILHGNINNTAMQ